jgi:hypothetical protein
MPASRHARHTSWAWTAKSGSVCFWSAIFLEAGQSVAAYLLLERDLALDCLVSCGSMVLVFLCSRHVQLWSD